MRTDQHYLLRIAAPMIGISFLLLAMGMAAAWNVQRQQVTGSELIAQEVHSLFAAQDLYIDMREIRHLLSQYMRNRNPAHLEAIAKLHESTKAKLAEAKALSRTEEEQALIGEVETNYRRFFDVYSKVTAPAFSGDQQKELEVLFDDILTNGVVTRARDYMDMNRDVVDRTNATSRHTTDQVRQGFLLLGLCGGAAGLVAGLAIARGVSQSIVQLDVSVRGAAGKLSEVAGPVMISGARGFHGLEATVQQMEEHIGVVVGKLQQREIEILRAEQLAALGQLSAGIAHELRNPLMPIKMLVQAAIDRGDEKGLHGRQLEVIEQEISRLETSIQAFLDFARPPTLEKQSFDVCRLLEQTIDLVSGRAAQQNVELVRKIPGEPLLLEGDPAQIRQVVLNLLLNAFDALTEAGRVTVEVHHGVGIPAGGAAPSGVDSTETAVIRISDTGPGLSPETLAHVFDPFVTTKETGTGLGLTITRRIVEAHGGTITAGNGTFVGAVFTVYLPASSESGAAVNGESFRKSAAFEPVNLLTRG